MIANSITFSRILFSFMLIIFPPDSCFFVILYLLCGITDVLDGVVARKLHTQSKTGEMLDSIADLFFTVGYIVKILPILSVPIWIWIWTALITAVKIFGIAQRSIKERRFFISHSPANKLTGFLIFLLPMSVYFIDIKYSAAVVCIVATYTAVVNDLIFKKD